MNLGNESETVEFKKSTGEHKEALQAICAMLNKHGHGELYFGVKDNGDVIGQEGTDSTIRQIGSWISDKIEPAISPIIEQLNSDDRTYFHIVFSGTNVPYSADGRYFTRVGTSNRAVPHSDLQAMMLKRAQLMSPWDSWSSGKPLSCVDEEVVQDFVARGNKAMRINMEFTNVPDALARLGMIAEDGTLTNAAVELFCQGPDIYPRIKMGLLAGNNKVDILDLRQECLPMLRLLDRAEYFIASNIRRRLVIGETGMERQEVPEIPQAAIREAVANALCHRDYTTGTAVEVNVYMDTVEIVSPGLFPQGDSPEKHLTGEAGIFGQRNPRIAQALFRAGVIEQYGTGIPRIKQVCNEAGVGFRYSQTDNTTVLTFDRPGAKEAFMPISEDSDCLAHSKGNGIPLDVFASLDKKEKAAVRLAAQHEKVTPRTLAAETQTSRKTAAATLKGLASKNILLWSGKSANDPYQFYYLP